MTEEIILNRIQCNLCEDVITSHHRHDFVTCKCTAVSVDGGRQYLKRGYSFAGIEGSLPYTELSVMSSAPFEEVRVALMRGSRGKDGDQPLTWIPLSEISDSYLVNLLDYQYKNNYTDSIDYRFQLMEVVYRVNKNITVEEK